MGTRLTKKQKLWKKQKIPPFLLGQYFVNKKSRIKKYMENSWNCDGWRLEKPI